MLTKASISVVALTAMLAAAPASAQDAPPPTGDEPNLLETILDIITPDAPPEGTEGEGEGEPDVEGNFSRQIPPGLKERMTEEEIADYQARLDAAQTPQERNEIRKEFQRMVQERHKDEITTKQQDKKAKSGGKSRGGKSRGGRGGGGGGGGKK